MPETLRGNKPDYKFLLVGCTDVAYVLAISLIFFVMNVFRDCLGTVIQVWYPISALLSIRHGFDSCGGAG